MCRPLVAVPATPSAPLEPWAALPADRLRREAVGLGLLFGVGQGHDRSGRIGSMG